ncbi:MAG: Fis family transcriptional regulator [Hyphomonas sp. BRH_c22]|nr:MAG: Fis family transcriptional regulator [Hyphomonas sp. BRH_c22]
MSDLAERLRFDPKSGRIWLDHRRMFLMHTRSFGELRREMISEFGMNAARSLLTRLGYLSGTIDAKLATKIRSDRDDFDAFSTGPQMHALLGIVRVECVAFEMDQAKGKFFGEYLWHDSVEDECHIRDYGLSDYEACWMQVGYASGFTSAFLGRPALFREVECTSMGYKHCRIIGKPVEEWEDVHRDLHFIHGAGLDRTDSKEPLKPNHQHTSASIASSLAFLPTKETSTSNQIVGTSAGFRTVKHFIDKVAQTNATVLLMGESGVGKEVFAQYLHRSSKRSDKPIIAVNCAAIPENLLEAELFGVEKGAFTGATSSRPGRFERAENGTIFLDEIGTLSLSSQGKLLRVLQEGEVERVGATQVRKIDIRVVAATNVDLEAAVEAGNFREDLYYRLSVFPVNIPPLRERRADIPLLLDYFLKKFTQKHGKTITGYSEKATSALFSYNWPGNIREMENMVERGVILAEEDGYIDFSNLILRKSHNLSSVFSMGENGELSELFHAQGRQTEPTQKPDTGVQNLLASGLSFAEIEAKLLRAAVDEADGNLAAAARKIGLTRPQLAYRLDKLDINGGCSENLADT